MTSRRMAASSPPAFRCRSIVATIWWKSSSICRVLSAMFTRCSLSICECAIVSSTSDRREAKRASHWTRAASSPWER